MSTFGRRVHHGDPPDTRDDLRRHPLEGMLFVLRCAFAKGVCIGLFVTCVQPRIDAVSIAIGWLRGCLRQYS